MRSDSVIDSPNVWLIGNPASRRVALFQDAAHRMGGIPVDVISYPDLIRRVNIRPPHADTVIRIESPGECAETTRLILKAGIRGMELQRRVPISEHEIDRLSCERGEILHPLQWYLGLRQILLDLDAEWSPLGVRWMSTPKTIATLFDKLACLELWSHAGLPIPHRYPRVSTYAELRGLIPDRHARLFIKLRYGYSAIGAIALEWCDSLVRAITTLDVIRSDGRPRLFLRRKPRSLHREFEIAWLIDTLAMEEILVEDWLPKAVWRGRSFDLRFVTIDRQVHHVVGRANGSPFTNLNLDAQRICREEVQDILGDAWQCSVDVCSRAAALLPDAGMLGIDLLVRPCRRKFVLLEANAFGDYLPGLLWGGMTTYEAEVRELLLAERMTR